MMLCLHQQVQVALKHYHLPYHCHHGLLPMYTSSLSLTKSNVHLKGRHNSHLSKGRRSMIMFGEEEEEEDEESSNDTVLLKFEEAIKLFNRREYYACHDFLESLWYQADDPLRTLLHGLLQCSVAFHHLFNQNHKGAMMEMGEGVCKLRKLNFNEGPFHEFEQQVSGVLNFIYQTQLELAACNEDFCVAMGQNERSYQLLAGFGAGQRLYFLEQSDDSDDEGNAYIAFDPQASYGGTDLPKTRVQLPILQATRDHLVACENY